MDAPFTAVQIVFFFFEMEFRCHRFPPNRRPVSYIAASPPCVQITEDGANESIPRHFKTGIVVTCVSSDDESIPLSVAAGAPSICHVLWWALLLSLQRFEVDSVGS